MPYWTNQSVRTMTGSDDPIDVITQKSRKVIFHYLERGGQGPPFNPFEIAEHLKIEVRPTEDVRDAKTLFHGGKFIIEFNPNRPIERINYSVAHEIVHTFFPDCRDEVRNRTLHSEAKGDDWQLELLCNIGAAELLMPLGSFPNLRHESLSIIELLKLQQKFKVSTEALLLRYVKLTGRSCWAFATSRPDPQKSQYRLDYAIPSKKGLARITPGLLLPLDSAVTDCTAIGFTSMGVEQWKASIGKIRVECVGIPPYPGHIYPRVIGVARPDNPNQHRVPKPILVVGDATKPRGEGRKLIAFIVNDATPRWGAGFALAVKRRWPSVQTEFVAWAEANPQQFKLGKIGVVPIDDNFDAACLICQRGYGESPNPRLRYGALEECLTELAHIAKSLDASVHMPLIGAGQARGNWTIISEMIERLLCHEGVDVRIYELPGVKTPVQGQMPLLFSE